MGRDLHYRPGSFYRVSDRSGFVVRAERTRKEWTGHIVAESEYEIRQPQDLVRGVRDDQTVPDSKPLAPDTFLGAQTTIAVSAAAGAIAISVVSAKGISSGDTLAVILDNGGPGIFLSKVNGAPVNNVVQLSAPLPFKVSAGNAVQDYSVQPAQQNPSNFPASH